MEEPNLQLSDEAELQHILAVLRATPGCTAVGESAYNGSDLNRLDVHAKKWAGAATAA